MGYLLSAQFPKSLATPAFNTRTSAQLPPRFAPGRRFRSRLFTPLLVTRSPRQVGLGPHAMDWAVNTRCRRRLSSGDGSGARRLSSGDGSGQRCSCFYLSITRTEAFLMASNTSYLDVRSMAFSRFIMLSLLIIYEYHVVSVRSYFNLMLILVA